MRNVIRYCQPNWLTEVEIQIEIDRINRSTQRQFNDDDNDDIFLEARPFFHRLEKLTINCKGLPKLFYTENRFLWHSPHLNSLTLERCNLGIDWSRLIPVELSSISELRLFNVSLHKSMIVDESLNGFRSLLDRLPHLEVFVNCNLDEVLEIENVTEELVRRYPNLRGFGYNIKDRIFHNDENIEFIDRYRFLTRFTNLTEFHLGTSLRCQDAHNILGLFPKIEIFGIHQFRLKHPLVEIRRMVRSIRKIVEDRRKTAGTGGKQVIQLKMNVQQYNDFIAIKPTQRMAIVASKCNCCHENCLF